MLKGLRQMFHGKPSPPALFILRLGLALSCVILAIALLVLVYAGPMTARNVHIHRLIADLYRAPQGVLLVTFIGALIVECQWKEGR